MGSGSDAVAGSRRWWPFLRGGAGSLLVVAGGAWALQNDSPRDLAVGLVFAAAGLILVRPPRRWPPARFTGPLVAAGAVAGTWAGTLVQTSNLGGMFVYYIERGWPFPWQTRSATSDDPNVAQQVALATDWSTREFKLALTIVFWSIVAVLAALAVTATGRQLGKLRTGRAIHEGDQT